MEGRRSNIEVVRIASMVMIVCHHFAVHGGFYFRGGSVTGNMLILQGMSLVGKVGVNLFVLITGYFGIRSGNLSRRKLLATWGMLLFYSVGIYLLACLTGLVEFTLTELGRVLLPVLSNQWWFASTWFFLSLLAPWLSRWLVGRSRRGYLAFLLVFTLPWYAPPVLTGLPDRVRDLLWFLYLYSIAGYLRLYGKQGKGKLWLGLSLAALLGAFFQGWAGMADAARSGLWFAPTYFEAQHLLILLGSVFLFRAGLAWELGVRPRINALAKGMFGIYLIHDSDHLRYPLWQDLLQCSAWVKSPWMGLYAAGCVAGVFLICLGLELLRGKIRTLFYVKKEVVSVLDKGHTH